MTKEQFVSFSDFFDWLKSNQLSWWLITKSVLLLYIKNIPYGFAIERINEKNVVLGYDIIVDIPNLPTPKISRDNQLKNIVVLKNEIEYNHIAIDAINNIVV